MAEVVDDQWPSLAPIRTSSAATCSRVSCETLNLQDSHRRRCSFSSINSPFSADGRRQFSLSPSEEAPASADHAAVNSTRSSFTSRASCMRFFSNCFSRRSMRPACMPRKRPMLRSMVGFPAGGVQMHYSSPTSKGQLSGTSIQSTFSGKFEQYVSPRTQQFSGATAASPRTQLPGAPNQQFPGAIPSPRTQFTGAISPSSARSGGRRKAAGIFTMIPPGTAGKKKSSDYHQPVEEPTSPEVTCIGRVRRKTHCKNYFKAENPHHHQCRIFKKKGKVRKKVDSQSPKNSHACEPSTPAQEICTQRFGKRKLHNLHKVHGFHDQLTAEDLAANIDLDHFIHSSDAGIDSGPKIIADPECLNPNNNTAGSPAQCPNPSINLIVHDLECRNPMNSSFQQTDEQPAAMAMNSSVAARVDHVTVCFIESAGDLPPPLSNENLEHKAHPSQPHEKIDVPSRDLVSSQTQPPPPPPPPPANCLLLIRSISSRRGS